MHLGPNLMVVRAFSVVGVQAMEVLWNIPMERLHETFFESTPHSFVCRMVVLEGVQT
jgi:hypothetical protein